MSLSLFLLLLLQAAAILMMYVIGVDRFGLVASKELKGGLSYKYGCGVGLLCTGLGRALALEQLTMPPPRL